MYYNVCNLAMAYFEQGEVLHDGLNCAFSSNKRLASTIIRTTRQYLRSLVLLSTGDIGDASDSDVVLLWQRCKPVCDNSTQMEVMLGLVSIQAQVDDPTASIYTDLVPPNSVIEDSEICNFEKILDIIRELAKDRYFAVKYYNSSCQ